MFSLALASLALAAPALALPTRESTGAWCAGLGAGAFDTASNFTLAAHNTTAPAPGAALVLGQAGAIAGAQFGVLSTYASYPYDAWPTFALAAGALLPVPADASAVPASDVPVSAGAQPGWIITSRDPPAPAQIYCAVAGAGPGRAVLAVDGDADGFALCAVGGQNNVVYRPSAASEEYDYASCYAVRVLLVWAAGGQGRM